MTIKNGEKTIRLICGDSIEELKNLEENSVDSIVTDPPAGIAFMGKSWDSDKGGRDHWIAWMQEVASECNRVLKPGGHALVWAIPRTSHWTATAWENAGFEVRDIIAHVFGSGFPKSHNIGKAVDKLQGNERKTVGETKIGKTSMGDATGWDTSENMKAIKESGSVNITKGNSPYEGWGTALKPAREDWLLLRKPLSEKTIAKNVLKYGTGGINIDGCRVEGKLEGDPNRFNKTDGGDFVAKLDEAPVVRSEGRFPANLIHDGSDEVVELFPDSKGDSANRKPRVNNMEQQNCYGKYKPFESATIRSDSGSASRFFYCAKSSKSDRNEGLDSLVSIMIEYKIWNEKNTTEQVKKVQLLVDTDKSAQRVIGVYGLENKEGTAWNTVLFGNSTMEQFQEVNKSITKTETNSITTSEILNWLTHYITKEYTVGVNYEMENGGSPAANVENCNTLITTINEKMESALGVKNVVSGTQLKISVNEGKNYHSTVKPTALMQYLVRLVTPKGGTVLDPFMGSGSTGKACKLEGFDFIGIDLDEEYVKISEARINNVTI